jgi:alginate O-acetyltransferase complex protein AlgI
MTFTSIHYLLFFPLACIVYYAIPYRIRWAWLLAASCYFYMVFRPAYILILFFLIIVDYIAARLIERSQDKRRMLLLLVSCVANCSVLMLFKYFNFINSQLHILFDHYHVLYTVHDLGWILPIGLSFHTFQSLGYVIDVYRGRSAAEKHLGYYALYVMFFPQLVAGPIERCTHLLPQLRTSHPFTYQTTVDGLKLIAWGFFQKLAIADRLALFVIEPYKAPASMSGLTLLIATVFFAFQIYADFSAYSNIAVGSASVLGIRLMDNFNAPYLASSPRDFWRRWHISLSTWFRDYVYFPLGGNRIPHRRHTNILIVFLISGLWHGANWTFCIWGLFHGVFLIIESWIEQNIPLFLNISQRKTIIGRLIGIILTFSLVCIGWVFFRASSIPQAVLILQRIMNTLAHPFSVDMCATFKDLIYPRLDIGIAAALIGVLLAVDVVHSRFRIRRWVSSLHPYQKWPLYIGSIFALCALGQFYEKPFIYFQF